MTEKWIHIDDMSPLKKGTYKVRNRYGYIGFSIWNGKKWGEFVRVGKALEHNRCKDQKITSWRES